MKDNNSFARTLGQILGGILVTCVAICAAAIALGLTYKFIMWIF